MNQHQVKFFFMVMGMVGATVFYAFTTFETKEQAQSTQQDIREIREDVKTLLRLSQ